MEAEDDREVQQKVPNKNPSIQQIIMLGLVLEMKLKMKMTTKMMSGVQEGKALKMRVLLGMRRKCRKIKITSSMLSKKFYLFIYLIINLFSYSFMQC